MKRRISRTRSRARARSRARTFRAALAGLGWGTLIATGFVWAWLTSYAIANQPLPF